MSFIVLPSTITNPQNIPVTLTADSTAPMYASLTYTFTITDLDSYVTYTVSATNGTVSRTGGTISYTPASAGTGGFTINNRSIPLTISANPTPSYLLFGGGGSAGRGSPSGGGGAGGYLAGSVTVTPGTPYTITIGAGGAGSQASYQAGNPGSTTSFGANSVIGGAGGAGEQAYATSGGASGGGGSSGGPAQYATGSAGTSGLGFAGGNAGDGGGGGGGALGAGESVPVGAGGYGGNGYVVNTLYPTVTSSTSQTIGTGTFTFTVASGLQFVANQNIRIGNGSNYMYGLVTSYSGTSLIFESYFVSGSGTFTSWTINNMLAGGGGGGGFNIYGRPGGRGGTGNVSGSGAQGNGNAALAGTAGGGGGGGYANWTGGAGGSGCVIIRVSGAANATTGSPSVCTDGAFYIYTFTASGTITF